jgi:hypothetical protein
MTRLVQLQHATHGRRVGMVRENHLGLLKGVASIYELAQSALGADRSLESAIKEASGGEELDYDTIYAGHSEWRILPAFDHPGEPARCLVTGTGLTHKASADNRQAMHDQKGSTPNHQQPEKDQAPSGSGRTSANTVEPPSLTDSMRMYQWGLEGGRPAPGQIGVSPEWFYKGCGTILRGHGDFLEVPSFADDGGEEAEVAGVYVIDRYGNPRRVGFVLANEFSDHVFEQKNYLYLAHSKLRTCSIGPELIVNSGFQEARGTIRLWRGAKLFWKQSFATGEKNMSHTLANLEHHHFKYPEHRRAGDAHVYFFGADKFSFGDNIQLQDGDIMEIELEGFGRALRNPIRIDRSPAKLVTVSPL